MSAHNIFRKLKILETIPKSENNMNFYLIFVYYSTSMEISLEELSMFCFHKFYYPLSDWGYTGTFFSSIPELVWFYTGGIPK